MNASGLTNDMLNKKYCYDAILLYLKEGEVREDMIKKFGGNVVTTIQFLRNRSYEGMEIMERKPKPVIKKKVEQNEIPPSGKEPKSLPVVGMEEPNIIDPMYDPAPMPEPEKLKGKKKSSAIKKDKAKSSGKQEELF